MFPDKKELYVLTVFLNFIDLFYFFFFFSYIQSVYSITCKCYAILKIFYFAPARIPPFSYNNLDCLHKCASKWFCFHTEVELSWENTIFVNMIFFSFFLFFLQIVHLRNNNNSYYFCCCCYYYFAKKIH